MGTGKQRRALILVALAAVLANASWFSATAVVPALQRDWHLTSAGAAWLVIMVQIGFVTGSVGAALLNLPDRIEPRWLIAGSAVAAGVTNLACSRPRDSRSPCRCASAWASLSPGSTRRRCGWSRRTSSAGAASPQASWSGR